jgi:hypothetical protein
VIFLPDNGLDDGLRGLDAAGFVNLVLAAFVAFDICGAEIVGDSEEGATQGSNDFRLNFLGVSAVAIL